jgi:signal transduction histidine kinase/tetratricopeptide (TPR) repeat protein
MKHKPLTYKSLYTLLSLAILSLFGGKLSAQDGDTNDAIWNLIIEADSLLYIEPATSQTLAGKAFVWAQEIGDSNTWAEAMHTLAEAFYYQNQLDTASTLLNKAMRVFEREHDSLALSMCIFSLANVQGDYGNYAAALRLYNQSLKIDLALGDSSSESYVLLNIAGIHFDQGDIDLAEEKFQRVLELIRKDGQLTLESSALLGLGKIMILKGELSEASLLLNRSMEIMEKEGNKLDLVSGYTALSSYYVALNNQKKALYTAKEALKLAEDYGDPYTKIEALTNYASVLNNYQNFEEAYRVGLEAYTLALDQAGYYLKYISLKPLSEAAEKKGLYKEALAYYQAFKQYSDSAYENNINEYILEHSLSQTSDENESLQRKSYLQKQVIQRDFYIKIGLGALAILFIFLIITVSISANRRSKLSQKLQEKNDQIAAQQRSLNEINEQLTKNNALLNSQNANKDKVFSILSHDLREPFNQLIGILELMQGENGLEQEQMDFILPKLKESVYNAQSSVVNLLHWSKNQLSEIKTEPERFQVQNLMENIKRSLLPTFDRKELDVSVHYDSELELFADYYQLEIALRNVVSNAIKFSPKKGKLTLSAELNIESKEVIFAVHDSGKGLSETQIKQILENHEDKSPTLGTFNERGTGLGLNIVKDFLHANGGYLTIDSTPGKGSTFQLHLPYLL